MSIIDTHSGKLLMARALRPFNGGFVGYDMAMDAAAGRVIICENARVHLLDALNLREVASIDLGSGIYTGNCAVAVDEGYHVAYVSSPGGFKAIDTRSGMVLSSQMGVILRGGQVAVDGVTHHVFVGGPHFGPQTAFAAAAALVNNALHRQFWITGSSGYTWAVSTIGAAR